MSETNELIRAEVLPWKCYDLETKTLENGPENFVYLCASQQATSRDPHPLSSEPYNHELRLLNTEDDKAVIEFIENYGLPFSVFYDSKTRFFMGLNTSERQSYITDGIKIKQLKKHVRKIKESLLSDPEVPKTRKGKIEKLENEENRIENAVFDCARLMRIRLELLALIDAPYDAEIVLGILESEIARRSCYRKRTDHSACGGIISLREVKTNLRILQMAPVLTALEQYYYDSGSNWDVNDIVAYLHNKKFVNQNGPIFFFHIEVPGLRLPRILDIPGISPLLVEYYVRGIEESEQTEDPEDKVRAFLEHILLSDILECCRSARSFVTRANVIKSEAMLTTSSMTSSALNIICEDIYSDKPISNSDNYDSESVFSEIQQGVDQWASQPSEKAENAIDDNPGSLTEACLNLFNFELNHPAPFKRCEHCGRIFKFLKESNLTAGRLLRPANYCKKSCGIMATRKN